MSCDIEPVSPDGPLWRVARRPDAWAWLDWSFAGPDGTFGNRFDDPLSEYRVLYASSRFGAYLEVLARYRPDPAVADALAEIEAERGDEEPEPAGRLPEGWVESRVIGSATSGAPFAGVGRSRSLAYLGERLAARVIHYGVRELDAAAIRLSVPRRLTQEISRLAFECASESGDPEFAGIAYGSRLGDEISNWAIFERPDRDDPLAGKDSQPVEPDDPELRAALEHLGLTLD